MLDWLLTLDGNLYVWIGALPHPPWLTAVMRTVSLVGAGSAIWWLLTLRLAITGERAGAFRTALALLVTAGLVGGMLKPLIGRERPALELRPTTHDAASGTESASFPSGHAAGASVGAYALSRFWPARPLWSLAILVVLSRAYLGVHYPSDLAAGILVGLGCGILITGGMRYRWPPPRIRWTTKDPPRPGTRPSSTRLK